MDRITTDVLIVGGSLAGLRAAIAAAELGVEVTLVSKSEVALDNCAAVAWGAASGAVGGKTEEEYLALLRGKSGGLADERLQRILAYESSAALQELGRLGVVFETHKGSIMLPGPIFRRGEGLMKPLLTFAEAKGVRMRWPVCVAEIIVENGACCGAVGLDLRTGKTVAITAKAVVLCGGGHAGIFLRHDNPGRTTGDCAAMASRVGCELVDMEFVQMHTLGLAEGAPPFDTCNFTPALSAGALQLADKSPLDRADLDDLWRQRASSLRRDDERFDAFLDLTTADWREERAAEMRRVLLADLPVEERPLRVSPLAHYTTGGIAIGPHGDTAARYLFAAGECTGGVFGAGRPGGSALTDCLVFGRRAGCEAGRQAKERGEAPQIPAADIDLRGTDDPGPLLNDARALLWNFAAVARHPEGLSACAAALARLGNQGRALCPRSPEAWLALSELGSVTLVGQALVAAALRGRAS